MFISTVFININQPILVLQAKRLKGLMRDPIFAKVAFRLKRQRSGGDGLGQNWKAWNNHEQGLPELSWGTGPFFGNVDGKRHSDLVGGFNHVLFESFPIDFHIFQDG